MRKIAKKIEARDVPFLVIEKNLENLFPKTNFLKVTNKVSTWEMVLDAFDDYCLRNEYYSEGIFVHSEDKRLPQKQLKKLPYFSERIFTKQYILITQSYTSIVSIGKLYQIILHIDSFYPKGEKCIIGDNGELVTLLCVKYQIQD